MEEEQDYNILHQIPNDKYHIGIDEVGRGPLLGRVYVACVVFPKTNINLDRNKIKDSKMFSSKKKILDSYQYIKERCISYSVDYSEVEDIDRYNILQATIQAMHRCLYKLYSQCSLITPSNSIILVDGTYFKQFVLNNIPIQHYCIRGGDKTHSCISSASILAKVHRDDYIKNLCDTHTYLLKYSIDTNKGYGTKQHRDALYKYGCTSFHRLSFGICKKINSLYSINENTKT